MSALWAQRWQALAQAGSRIAVSNERLINLLVHNCQGRRFAVTAPMCSPKEEGSSAPSFSTIDFEHHFEHDWRAQRQAGDSYNGPHGHLAHSKYIAEKL